MGGNENGRGMGERLAVDPNNNTILYFGSRTAGLWMSSNSGTSWAQVTGFPTAGDSGFGLPVVVFDKRGGTSAGSTTIYVAAASKGAGSNLYRTTNGGASWALVSGGPTGLALDTFEVKLTPAPGTVLDGSPESVTVGTAKAGVETSVAKDEETFGPVDP